MLGEFRKFALRGNMIDLAVGITVGTAFSTIAKSFVSDIIMPPIGLVLGQVDFADIYLLLRPGPEVGPKYATLADAQAAGAITINVGTFLNNVIAFMAVALAMFFIVRVMNEIEEELEEEFGQEEKKPTDPTSKKCPYCLSTVPFRSVRCAFCTSDISSAAKHV